MSNKKENAVTAEEILLDHVNVYNGMIESVPIQIINAMIKYSASQNTDLIKEIERLKGVAKELGDESIQALQQLSEKEKECEAFKHSNKRWQEDYSELQNRNIKLKELLSELQSKANKLAEALEVSIKLNVSVIATERTINNNKIKNFEGNNQDDYNSFVDAMNSKTAEDKILINKLKQVLSEFKGKETNG